MKKLALALPLLFIGCATIFSGTKDTVHFNSNPEGAVVLINGVARGTTPASIVLDRPGFSSHTVTMRKEGFRDISFVLGKSFNAVSVLNLGAILFWGVDMLTGAVMKNDQPMGPIELEAKRTEVSQMVHVQKVSFASELKRDDKGAVIVESSNAPVAVIHEDTNSVVVFN